MLDNTRGDGYHFETLNLMEHHLKADPYNCHLLEIEEYISFEQLINLQKGIWPLLAYAHM